MPQHTWWSDQKPYLLIALSIGQDADQQKFYLVTERNAKWSSHLGDVLGIFTKVNTVSPWGATIILCYPQKLKTYTCRNECTWPFKTVKTWKQLKCLSVGGEIKCDTPQLLFSSVKKWPTTAWKDMPISSPKKPILRSYMLYKFHYMHSNGESKNISGDHGMGKREGQLRTTK